MTERAPVIAARLREVFADSCREHEVKATLEGEPPTLKLTLQPQEGADEALLDKLFRQEMETAGVPLEQALAVGDMDDALATRMSLAAFEWSKSFDWDVAADDMQVALEDARCGR